MNPWLARVLFYGGNVVVVVVMSQDFFRRFLLSMFGDSAGQSLFAFIRTNVEAPVSIIALALYLDLVLRHRRAPNTVHQGDS